MKLFYRKIEAQCRVEEAKEDLIIIHGLFGMSDNWLKIGKELSVDRKIIIPDLRNHGRSPHSSEFSIPILSKDLIELIENENCVNPILLGHSLGGRIVADIAFNYSKIISKVIIADMNLGEIKLRAEHESLFFLMKNAPLSNMKSIGEIDKFLSIYVKSERIKMFILKNIHKNTEGIFDWKLNFPVLMGKFNQMMPKIDGEEKFTKPSLIIRGEKSDYVSDIAFKHIQEHFTDIRLKTISNASHWLHVDNPSQFINILKTFIQE